MNRIQEITQDPRWQRVRVHLLGKWMKYPETCVEHLRVFLGSIPEASLEDLLIIRNYLTGSGFRTRRISHPSIDRLLDQVREEIMKRRKS